MIRPRSGDPHIGLVHPPGPIGMPDFTAKPLIQNGSIVLDPAPDRDVVHRQIPLRHHLLQISIAQGVSQIPANAQKDDHVLEMSSRNSTGRFWVTEPPYQI